MEGSLSSFLFFFFFQWIRSARCLTEAVAVKLPEGFMSLDCHGLPSISRFLMQKMCENDWIIRV